MPGLRNASTLGTPWRALALIVSMIVGTLATPRQATAADIGTPNQRVALHGFVSPGYIASTGNNYLADTKGGSFEFVEVGLNLTVPLTDKLRTGMQLFSRKLGQTGDYVPKMDWFYLDYRFEDWIGIRAGRVKIPFGLYNDTADIDAARVPILLPQSIYSLQSRDFLLSQTGGELYGRIDMGSAGTLEYRHYAGTIFLDTRSSSTLARTDEISVPYLVGERIMWETPLEGLRRGGSLQALRLDARLTVKDRPVKVELPAVLAVASVEYVGHDLLLAAEYSRWRVALNTSDSSVVPPSGNIVSERAYGMAAYRLSKWVQPGAYYSLYFPDVDKRSGRAQQQHDVAATLRFDLNEHWLLKLEGHYINGTADVSPALNDNVPKEALQRSWALFLAKTTVYF